MKRRAKFAALLVAALGVCHGFSPSLRYCVVHQYLNPSMRLVKGSRWHHHSPGMVNSLRNLPAKIRASHSSSDDGGNKRSARQALQQAWSNFKFGATTVNENYLSLLVCTASKALMVVTAVWVAIGFAFLLSPVMGRLAVRYILQALKVISYFEVMLIIPFIIVFGIALGLLLSLPKLAVTFVIPNRIANTKTVASFLRFWEKAIRNVFPEATVDVTQNTKTTAKVVAPILERTGTSYALQLCLLAPILEELQYRLLFDRIRSWLATITTSKSRSLEQRNDKTYISEGFQLSTKIGSFIFACAHIKNWVSPSLDAVALVNSSVPTALLILSLAVVQGTGAFYISDRVLFPVYEKRGVVASIGAHSIWNILFATTLLHVPIRLLKKLRKRIRMLKDKGAA